MSITITEKRFRDATGIQYMSDGVTIRCQGLSKSQLRKWREDHNDYVTPSEDLWPECQCSRSAVPGMFACKWHGGVTASNKITAKTLLDTLPVDLGNKFKTLVEDPMYISRRSEIALIQSRNWELMEELENEVGSEESWGYVAEALVELKKQNQVAATMLLQEALKQNKKRESIWQEVRANSTVLKDLTNTQIRTAEKLQSMATTEQVSALMQNLLKTISQGANKYIDDPNDRIQFLQYITGNVARFTNIGAINAVSGSVRRDE